MSKTTPQSIHQVKPKIVRCHKSRNFQSLESRGTWGRPVYGEAVRLRRPADWGMGGKTPRLRLGLEWRSAGARAGGSGSFDRRMICEAGYPFGRAGDPCGSLYRASLTCL